MPGQDRWCDFEKLEQIVSAQFGLGEYSEHGPFHWKRVEKNGIRLTAETGADLYIVRLFAWFHDSRRENEGHDPAHGKRGGEYSATLRGKFFGIEDEGFEKLIYACKWHTDRHHADEPTIGTCWDSDRLDLGRVGIIPSPEYMSTDSASGSPRRALSNLS
jgi:uncharacterized protein